jgi:hypothetical protein
MRYENREKLIEKYRYTNVEDYQWWDCVYADFAEDMRGCRPPYRGAD